MSIYKKLLEGHIINYVEIHANAVQIKLGNGDLHVLKEEWEKENHGIFKDVGYVEVSVGNGFIKAIMKSEIDNIIDVVINTKL